VKKRNRAFEFQKRANIQTKVNCNQVGVRGDQKESIGRTPRHEKRIIQGGS